jgi:hypothetical protein
MTDIFSFLMQNSVGVGAWIISYSAGKFWAQERRIGVWGKMLSMVKVAWPTFNFFDTTYKHMDTYSKIDEPWTLLPAS